MTFQPYPAHLHTKHPKPASLWARFKGSFHVIQLIIFLLYLGLPGAILAQIKNVFTGKPWRILNPNVWRNEVIARGMGGILAASNLMWADVKRTLLSQASGRVLEVGAGSGESVSYYNADKVSPLST